MLVTSGDPASKAKAISPTEEVEVLLPIVNLPRFTVLRARTATSS